VPQLEIPEHMESQEPPPAPSTCGDFGSPGPSEDFIQNPHEYALPEPHKHLKPIDMSNIPNPPPPTPIPSAFPTLRAPQHSSTSSVPTVPTAITVPIVPIASPTLSTPPIVPFPATLPTLPTVPAPPTAPTVSYKVGSMYVCRIVDARKRKTFRTCKVLQVHEDGTLTFILKGAKDKYNDWTGDSYSKVSPELYDVHSSAYHIIHRGKRRSAGGFPKFGLTRTHLLSWLNDTEYVNTQTRKLSPISLTVGEWFAPKGIPDTVAVVFGITKTDDNRYQVFLFCVPGTIPPTQPQPYSYIKLVTCEWSVLIENFASTYLDEKSCGAPPHFLDDEQCTAMQPAMNVFRSIIDDDNRFSKDYMPHKYFRNIKTLVPGHSSSPEIPRKRKRAISSKISNYQISMNRGIFSTDSPPNPQVSTLPHPSTTPPSTPPPIAFTSPTASPLAPPTSVPHSTPPPTSTSRSAPPSTSTKSNSNRTNRTVPIPTPPIIRKWGRGISLKGLSQQEKKERARLQALQRSMKQKEKQRLQKKLKVLGLRPDSDEEQESGASADASASAKSDDSSHTPPPKKARSTAPAASRKRTVLKTTVPSQAPSDQPIPSPESDAHQTPSPPPLPPPPPPPPQPMVPSPGCEWLTVSESKAQLDVLRSAVEMTYGYLQTTNRQTSNTLEDIMQLTRSMSFNINRLQEHVTQLSQQMTVLEQQQQLQQQQRQQQQQQQLIFPQRFGQFPPSMAYQSPSAHIVLPNSTVPLSTVLHRTVQTPPTDARVSLPKTSTPKRRRQRSISPSGRDTDEDSAGSGSCGQHERSLSNHDRHTPPHPSRTRYRDERDERHMYRKPSQHKGRSDRLSKKGY
jgi:hypothetical protein